jgi:hypothetical protein
MPLNEKGNGFVCTCTQVLQRVEKKPVTTDATCQVNLNTHVLRLRDSDKAIYLLQTHIYIYLYILVHIENNEKETQNRCQLTTNHTYYGRALVTKTIPFVVNLQRFECGLCFLNRTFEIPSNLGLIDTRHYRS